jgi:tetratricopeptide (TPR) repeat protein
VFKTHINSPMVERNSKLKDLECHFNWAFLSQNKFKERFQQNLDSSLKQMKHYPDTVVCDFVGYLYFQMNDFNKAEEYFKKALEGEPDNIVALSNLACLLQQMGRSSASQVYLSRLEGIDENKKQGMIHWSQAYCYLRLYEYNLAIEHYRLSSGYLLNEFRLPLYIGILLAREKKPKKALPYLEQALSKPGCNTDGRAYAHLGRVYAELPNSKARHLKLALQYFDKALKVNAHDEDALKFRAYALGKAGKIEQAIAYYTEIIQAKPSSYACHQRAILYQQAQRFEQAEEDLIQAIHLQEENYAAAIALIELKYELKNYNDLINTCRKLLLKNITSFQRVKTGFFLGQAFLSEGEIQEAERTFILALQTYGRMIAHGKKTEGLIDYAKQMKGWLGEYYKSHLSGLELLLKEIHLAFMTQSSHANNLIQDCVKKYSTEPDALYYRSMLLLQEAHYGESLAILLSLHNTLKYISIDEYETTLITAYSKVAEGCAKDTDYWMISFDTLTALNHNPAAIQLAQKLCQEYFGSGVEKLRLPSSCQIAVAAFLMNYWENIAEGPSKYQTEVDTIELSLGIRGELREEDIHRLYSPSNAAHLKNLIAIELGIKRLEWAKVYGLNKADDSALLSQISHALEESRKFLDCFFIAFCKKHYGAAIQRAPFPCVPRLGLNISEDQLAHSVEIRLKSFLEKDKYSYLGLKDFSNTFPQLFRYLLSIQPLINPQYAWLEHLYGLRNKIVHELGSIGNLTVPLGEKQINALQLAQASIRGIYDIVDNFHAAELALQLSKEKLEDTNKEKKLESHLLSLVLKQKMLFASPGSGKEETKEVALVSSSLSKEKAVEEVRMAQQKQEEKKPSFCAPRLTPYFALKNKGIVAKHQPSNSDLQQFLGLQQQEGLRTSLFVANLGGKR